MPYPSRPNRTISFRQNENAGNAIPTASLDADLNNVVASVRQVIDFLTTLAAADATVKDQFSQAFSSFAGSQRFVATSGQTVFQTSIPYVPTQNSANVLVQDNGVLVDPNNVVVSSYLATNNYYYMQVAVPAILVNHIVVVNAYDNNAYQMTERFVATASQTLFTTTIQWDNAMTKWTVDVYANGVRLDPNTVTPANNLLGRLVVTIPAQPVNTLIVVSSKSIGATILQKLADTTSFAAGANLVGLQDIDNLYVAATVEEALHEIRDLFNTLVTDLGVIADIWTRAGTSIGGDEASGDFLMGAQQIKNMANGSDPQDAVTLAQVASIAADLTGLLSIFIRKDGSVDFTADQSMGDNKLTDLAAATLSSTSKDAVRGEQLHDTNLLVAGKLSLTGAETMTGNLKMGGKKLTGVAAATADSDAPNWGQVKGIAIGLVFETPGSDTWTCPVTGDWLVEVIGGGGSGSQGRFDAGSQAGDGGRAGARVLLRRSLVKDEVYAYTVGDGGATGTAAVGNNGEKSSFDNTGTPVIALGGVGGRASQTATAAGIGNDFRGGEHDDDSENHTYGGWGTNNSVRRLTGANADGAAGQTYGAGGNGGDYDFDNGGGKDGGAGFKGAIILRLVEEA